MNTGPRDARLTISLSGTNLERAGDYNQRVVLQAIRRVKETTRGELVAQTGLTAPTIANITRRLTREGMIRDVGRLQQGRGQPALRIAINPDGGFGIGINIDRDHLSLIALDLAGEVRSSASCEIAYASPDQVRDFIGKQVDLLVTSGAIDPARIIGVGLAVPQPFSKPAFHQQPKAYEAWNDTDVRGLVADLLPWPTYIDNDAAAAAVGELHFGAGRACTDFFYVLISTGLGGGLVLDGSFYRGAGGRSGEIGFLLGRTGAAAGRPIETRVSLSALYDRLADAGCPSGSLAALDNPNDTSIEVIDQWIDEASDLLVDPLIAIQCLLNPQVTLIGGRLSEPLIDRLVSRLNAKLVPYQPDLPSPVTVRRAAMAGLAPAIGAALLPFNDRVLPSDAILMNVGR